LIQLIEGDSKRRNDDIRSFNDHMVIIHLHYYPIHQIPIVIHLALYLDELLSLHLPSLIVIKYLSSKLSLRALVYIEVSTDGLKDVITDGKTVEVGVLVRDIQILDLRD
jgi:hypothetical protein